MNSVDELGVTGDGVPSVVLDSRPGDVVVFNHNLLHSSWGGGNRRRMFTLNLARAATSEVEIQELKDYIAVHDRFWNPLTRQMESPPRALIDTYRAIRSQLARGGRFVVRKHRKLIVTRNTQSSGLKLIDLKRHAQDKPRTIDPTKSLGREEIKNESDKLR